MPAIGLTGGRGPEEALSRLVRHRPIQLLLAGDHILGALMNRAESEALGIPLPRDLVQEAASRIAGNAELVARLRSLVTTGGRQPTSDGRQYPARVTPGLETRSAASPTGGSLSG